MVSYSVPFFRVFGVWDATVEPACVIAEWLPIALYVYAWYNGAQRARTISFMTGKNRENITLWFVNVPALTVACLREQPRIIEFVLCVLNVQRVVWRSKIEPQRNVCSRFILKFILSPIKSIIWKLYGIFFYFHLVLKQDSCRVCLCKWLSFSLFKFVYVSNIKGPVFKLNSISTKLKRLSNPSWQQYDNSVSR